MKKILLILTLAVLCAANADAQFWVGAKAGFGAYWIPKTTIELGEQVVPHNAFYGGIVGGFEAGNGMILQTELLYSGKGFSSRTNNPDIATNDKYLHNIDYLQIPVMVGWQLLDDEALKLMLGPELGILLGDRVLHKDYSSGSEVVITDERNTGLCRPLNLALAFQATYMIFDNLGIDLKFDIALTRTFKQGIPLPDYMNDKGHNLGAQLGVVYMLDI